MIKPLELSRLARREYDEAGDWYEAKENGFGREFTSEVDAVLDNISKYPERYAVVFDDDVRVALVRRFPYAVYFREERNKIFIFAVIHTSRDPAEWQRRA